MHPAAIVLLLLFFIALAREVSKEMREQNKPKPPAPAPKKEDPPVINVQTNHYHLTQNNYTIKEKE